MTSVNSDLSLGTNFSDLVFTNFNLSINDEPQAVAQRIAVRLRIFLGEWFLDTTYGIPYYQSILVKAPDLNAIRTILRTQISTVPNVLSIDEFDFEYNTTTRTLIVNFTVTTTSGQVTSSVTIEN